MRKLILGILFFLLSLTTVASAKTINISPDNTTVMFQIVHGLGYTTGCFKDFAGMVEVSDDDSQLLSAKASVQLASLDTLNPVRDEGLRSSLFFDVEKFPQASYENGALTIKGITKPMAFVVKKDGTSGVVVLRGAFNRNDFGVAYNTPMSKGKKSIGDMVDVIIEIKS